MPREVRAVVLVDGVRTPFGKAGGGYANTRADDLVSLLNLVGPAVAHHTAETLHAAFPSRFGISETWPGSLPRASHCSATASSVQRPRHN